MTKWRRSGSHSSQLATLCRGTVGNANHVVLATDRHCSTAYQYPRHAKSSSTRRGWYRTCPAAELQQLSSRRGTRFSFIGRTSVIDKEAL
jgi:hypothetical protein